MKLANQEFKQAVSAALQTIPLQDAPSLSLADVLGDVYGDAHQLKAELVFGYPCASLHAAVITRARSCLEALAQEVVVECLDRVPAAQPANNQGRVPGVSNIIAVASGKGGVGKSTVTANLALALAAEGARVGILDADIYGPSQAQMMGVAGQRPEMYKPDRMLPIQAFPGVQIISMGNLVTENTPMVWRGPMVSGALQQLLNNTHWQDIDYLLVDMPPGTGDIQLTLSQSVPVSGSVIVTTPQDIALLDAKKGIEMFRKVQIPVLGVVENMSMHICSECGHEEAIFGREGGERLARLYDVALLGQLPLKMSICEQTDRGEPPVVAEPDSPVSKRYGEIARRMAAALWVQAQAGQQAPEIVISDD